MSPRAYFRHEHPIRFAHRGSRFLWPENTMVAFQGAVDLGYRYLETDVHLTADGRLVAFHDDSVDRITNGTGEVVEWRWDDLRHLDAAYRFKPEEGFPLRGTGVRIPLLEEVVASFPGVLLNIDMKEKGVDLPLADLVARLGIEDQVLAASFHDGRIRRFRDHSAGKVATSAGPVETTRVWVASRLGRTARFSADALQVPARFGTAGVVDARLIEAVHRAGKQVHVWTINAEAEMHRLLELGVDGIVTDRPDLLDLVVQRRRGDRSDPAG